MHTESSICQGCGSVLQSDRPDAQGYVPEHVLDRRESGVRCRRCYRIEQYGTKHAGDDGEADTVLDPLDAAEQVADTVSNAEVVVLVVDIWDFEGTFLPDLVTKAKGALVIAVNKIDLLPSRTPPHEVITWVKERCARANLSPTEVRLISAEKGTGVKALRQVLEAQLGSGGRVALVGTTNVGKSALVRGLLPKGANLPTTSTLPGTTRRAMVHDLGSRGHRLIDTPGVIPGHRIPDFLCPQCAAQLVPKKRLKSKLLHLGPGKGVLFGGLAGVRCEGSGSFEVVTLAFASDKVPIHYTRSTRVLELLQGADHSWLHTDCASCRHRIEQGGWEDVHFSVPDGDELAIPGLGWLSVRGSALDVTLTLPAGTLAQLRPRLIGIKSDSTHSRPKRRRPSKAERSKSKR